MFIPNGSGKSDVRNGDDDRDEDRDEDREWEANQEAEEDAAYDYFYNKIGPEWAREHGRELLDEHYGEAVEQFTSERLQSYYLANPSLATPARESLLYAQSLMPSFTQAALIFAVTATELTIKSVLLQPIITGLVHTEELASFIADLTTKHTGLERFHTLLTEILAQLGGVQLKTFKRANSTKTLWEEVTEVQSARNALIHRGRKSNASVAGLSISVAETLLNDIFPKIVANLGLHIDGSMNVCKRTQQKLS